MNSNSSSSQKNSVSTKNNPGGTTNYFEPEGCPAVIDGRRCGETKNLQIIQEFKRLYETKMKQIDDAAGGDCVQAKINLQQEWIRDLTEQNEMLVRVVEELEVEAAERVMRLEEKLQHSAKCACEKMGHIQNDLNNLIEVLKRVKNYGLWSSRGLNFYTINIEELMNGTDGDLVQTEINRNTDCNCNCNGDTSAICKNERLLKEKDRKLKDLEEKIKKLNEIAEKNEEARRTCQQYAELKKSMLDMRDALTAEVAEKHDTIVCLRREVHMLEEQCRKADQQTHFKDDIIKELRKEIKQLKLQRSKKTRSPRTVKRCEQRHLHLSRTDPDTNIRNIKDGTIVIKDTATVGDNVATQIIKEKYSDPSNQTVVYICECVPQRQKSKSRENSRIEPSLNQSRKDEQRTCDVSLDNSRVANARSMGDNSRDIPVDYARDASEDVSRDSGGNLAQKNFLVYPSIQETCIRYSKDILEMLNNHSLEEKKTLGEYSIIDENNILKSFNDDDDNKSREYEKCKNLEAEELKEVTNDMNEEESNCFLSSTLSRCEKYFLEMYHKKCNGESEIEKGKKFEFDDSYFKKIHECCYCEYVSEDCSSNLKEYEIPRSTAMSDIQKPISLYLTEVNEKKPREREVSCTSNACQTVGYYQLNKDTQTSKTHLLSDVICHQSTSCDDLPEPLASNNDSVRISEPVEKEKDEGLIASREDVDVCILRQNDCAEMNDVSTEEIWNNANVKSDEISFEEAEFRAYSSPFYEEVPNCYQHELICPEHMEHRRRKYEEYYPNGRLDECELFRGQMSPRMCEIPHRAPPLVPLRRYFLPPHLRQTRVLSPRTVRKIPSRRIHRPLEVPLSVKSKSLPTCVEVGTSGHEIQRPVRLHKVKRQHNCLGKCNFVDVAFMVEDRHFHKKLVQNELHGCAELSGRNTIGNGVNRSIREDCFGPWPNMNNTY